MNIHVSQARPAHRARSHDTEADRRAWLARASHIGRLFQQAGFALERASEASDPWALGQCAERAFELCEKLENMIYEAIDYGLPDGPSDDLLTATALEFRAERGDF